MQTFYSIGHSNHTVEKFISLLKSADISCLVDVRSSPYSQRLPQFNRELIMRDLADAKLVYLYMGDKLGGRYTDPRLLTVDGRVDYEKVMLEKKFQDGLDELIRLAVTGKKTAFMCAEKDPFDCHRFALVSRALMLKGQQVFHIMSDGKIVSNDDIERHLLHKYKLDYNQMDMFSVALTREEALAEAYAMRGKEIAYVGANNGWEDQ